MQVRRSYPFSATSATAISSSSRFLGSAGTFEACAKFCYNTISTHKLVLLRCAAAHRGKLGTSSTPLSLPPPLEGQNSPCSFARSSASPPAACMPLPYSSPARPNATAMPATTPARKNRGVLEAHGLRSSGQAADGSASLVCGLSLAGWSGRGALPVAAVGRQLEALYSVAVVQFKGSGGTKDNAATSARAPCCT
jgi:hypothetical protein